MFPSTNLWAGTVTTFLQDASESLGSADEYACWTDDSEGHHEA
jgi:hypothetical protein